MTYQKTKPKNNRDVSPQRASSRKTRSFLSDLRNRMKITVRKYKTTSNATKKTQALTILLLCLFSVQLLFQTTTSAVGYSGQFSPLTFSHSHQDEQTGEVNGSYYVRTLMPFPLK